MGIRTLRAAVVAFALAFPCAPAALAHEVGAPTTHGPDPASIDGPPRAGASAVVPPWCGRELAAGDPENEVHNGALRYQAVYAVPSDAPSRLQTVAGDIQAGAVEASGLIERLYGRAIRYDMGTACGPQNLDIVTLRLPQTTAELHELAATPAATFDAIKAALHAAGLEVIQPGEPYETAAARTRNWLVWLDGPAPAGHCGQAMLFEDAARSAQNLNALAGKVALVFREGERFCGADTVRHEILHTLGALLAGTPHGSGGHCTDAREDAMCLPDAPAISGGGYHSSFVDYGNDDYWDPPGASPLGWWTVNLSRFLCDDVHCNGVSSGRALRAGAPERAVRRPRPALRVKVRRLGSRWRIAMRARGGGTGTVAVRCRRRSGRVAIVLRRRVKLPRRVLALVPCAGPPRARLVSARS